MGAIELQFTTSRTAIESLRRTRGIRIEIDSVVEADYRPDELGETTWALQRISHPEPISKWHYQDATRTSWTYAYERYHLGFGTEIYVLDDGVFCDHHELEGRCLAPPGLDVTYKRHKDQHHNHQYDDEDRAQTDGADRHGPDRPHPQPKDTHGTWCAAAAAGNGIGVAAAATVISVQTEREGGVRVMSDLVAGIDSILQRLGKHNRPAVISASVSSRTGQSQALDNAVEAALASLVPYVVSAGNTNVDACTQSPHQVHGAIVVGSTDIRDRFARFSSWGKCVSIMAPGVDVITAAWSAKEPEIKDLYEVTSGTSLSTAYVAGAVAIALSMMPHKLNSIEYMAPWLQKMSLKGAIKSLPPLTPDYLLQTTFSQHEAADS
ncbi:proteinase B [Savitreella phatthalungensis]